MSFKRLGKNFRRRKEHSEDAAVPFIMERRENYYSPPPTDFEVRERNRTSSSDQGEDALPEDLSSQPSDDAIPENVEITEGGWVCQVERFDKRVDSRGRIRYRHPRKERSSLLTNQDSTDPQEPQISSQNKAEKTCRQSIISYFSHTTKTDPNDLIDPDIYIEIKSPLILEILRGNSSYTQKVWPYPTCRFRGWAYHWRGHLLIMSDSL